MTHSEQIRALEAQIEGYHSERMTALGVKSHQLIRALSEQEQIDWAAVATAKVEYEMPIGEENRDELEATYLLALGTYVETWVNRKSSP